MPKTVRVRPSGHQFPVERAETILTAGLREGLNLDYHCGNGSCGECRARLLSGTVDSVCGSDFRFSPAEQARGYILTCCSTPSSDVEIEAHETGSAAEIPFQELDARIAKLERLSDEVMQVHVRTPRAGTLRFLAGQHATVMTNDGTFSRELSLASCPCDGLHLRFHVRRNDGEPFSEYLFGRARKADTLNLKGPRGDFTLDEGSGRSLLFVAYGTGFAPVNSLIEHAIALQWAQPIQLHWIAENAAGRYLANYCRSWVDALDEFDFHGWDAGAAGLRDSIAVIAREGAPLEEVDVYLALPRSVRDEARDAFLQAGLPASQLRIDDLDHR